MKTLKSACIHVFILAHIFWLCGAYAQESRPSGLDIEWALLLESLRDSNATQVVSNPIQEQQNILSLEFNAAMEGASGSLESNYSYTEQQFSKNSQVKSQRLIGTAELHQHALSDRLGYRVRHDRRTVLSELDASFVESNTEEVESINISPYFQTELLSTNTFNVTGIYEIRDFPDSPLNNSTTTGSQFALQRDLSSLQQVGINVISMKTEFENLPTSDYDYRRVSAFYRRERRNIAYELEIGRDETSGNQFTSNESSYYRINGTFSSWNSQASFTSYALQTHSSNTANSFIGFGSVDLSSSVDDIDRVERRYDEITWEYPLCHRCNVTLSVARTKTDYVVLDQNDVNTRVAYGEFNYDVTSRLSVLFSSASRNTDFTSTSRASVASRILTLRANYQFSPFFDWGSFYRKNSESTEDGEANANAFGLYLRLHN